MKLRISIKNYRLGRIFFFVLLCHLWLNFIPVEAEIIFFADDSTSFNPAGADSVFIFSRNLAVSASGEGIRRLVYTTGAIRGENIPATLKLKNPIGAIIYRSEVPVKMVKVIKARISRTIPLAAAIRKIVFDFNKYKGASAKGGVAINAWLPGERKQEVLVFSLQGQIRSAAALLAGDPPGFVFDDIAGIWSDPPERGISEMYDEMLSLLQKGPLLVEYWDGLGWQEFEKAVLQGKIQTDRAEMEIVYVNFPPVTKINYPALAGGNGSKNIFQGLVAAGKKVIISEGEKMILPHGGKLILHPVSDPFEKDKVVFKDALRAARDTSLTLLFVHYHGLDDLNHTLGPHDSKSRGHLQRLWQYHKRLKAAWGGPMLIVSDHGAHQLASGPGKSKIGKGSHGEFIFADMAVPVIYDRGLMSPRPARLSQEQVVKIRARSLNIDQQLPSVDSTCLKITIFNRTILSGSNEPIFKSEKIFEFNYLRKGKPYSGKRQGFSLSGLLSAAELKRVKLITAVSYDGQTCVFSGDELRKNSLLLGVEANIEVREKMFTLYPLLDKFPSRIVKYLKEIIFE